MRAAHIAQGLLNMNQDVRSLRICDWRQGGYIRLHNYFSVASVWRNPASEFVL
jgi:hypothetical protein